MLLWSSTFSTGCACYCHNCTVLYILVHCKWLHCFAVLPAALFTEDPQNVTALLGTQAFFNCSFEDLPSFPRWEDTTGASYTTSDTTGDVRFVQTSNMSISLNVTATEARDGVCYFCIADLITSPIISESGCLTVAGKHSACPCNCIHQ